MDRVLIYHIPTINMCFKEVRNHTFCDCLYCSYKSPSFKSVMDEVRRTILLLRSTFKDNGYIYHNH